MDKQDEKIKEIDQAEKTPDQMEADRIIAYLKANGMRIGVEARNGDELARNIIKVYELFYTRQGPAEIGLLASYIQEWEGRTKK